MSDIIPEARKAANAVYLATEKSVADDLSRIITGLADEIDRLVGALEQVPRTVERLLTDWGKRDSLSDMLDEITAEVHAAIGKAKGEKP